MERKLSKKEIEDIANRIAEKAKNENKLTNEQVEWLKEELKRFGILFGTMPLGVLTIIASGNSPFAIPISLAPFAFNELVRKIKSMRKTDKGLEKVI